MADTYICAVCYSTQNNQLAFFECTKYHHMCLKCYNTNTKLSLASNLNVVCSTCRAPRLLQFINPGQLTFDQTLKINTKTIDISQLFIHQNINPSNYNNNFVTVISGKYDIKLYTKNGDMIKYLNMFIAQNGFLYVYCEELNMYYLKVDRDKFQFWDTSKITRKI